MTRPRLILGSSSPRRRDLLDKIGLSYEVLKPDVPEVLGPEETPIAYVTRLALAKATWVFDFMTRSHAKGHGRAEFIVISADTIVVLGKEILEKPSDSTDAARMLRKLSGATHTVHTGVCLLGQKSGASPTQKVEFHVDTQVTLKALSESEITAYIGTGEPLDKAGGYAAQGIGSYMVKRIEGSYANVVGLPVAELVERLERDFNYPLWS